VALVAALALSGLVACDPRIPPTLTVTSNATGGDAAPGDGVCEVTGGAGDCTLPAAVDEANALGRAAISVPAGAYEGMDLTVTGDVRLNQGAPADVVLGDVDITVAECGVLVAEGFRTRVTDPPPEGSNQPGSHPVTLSVSGELTLVRSTIASIGGSVEEGVPQDTTLVVAPGGRAVLNTSVLVGGLNAVVNDGDLASFASSLYSLVSAQLVTNEGATSQYARTAFTTLSPVVRVFSSCLGDGSFVSLGGNSAERAGCLGPDDVGSYAANRFDVYTMQVTWPAVAPTVDAIPVGTLLCDPAGTDIYGAPRGVDGNGDGTGGCDVGAAELQP
jgi:hypothetical protein